MTSWLTNLTRFFSQCFDTSAQFLSTSRSRLTDAWQFRNIQGKWNSSLPQKIMEILEENGALPARKITKGKSKRRSSKITRGLSLSKHLLARMEDLWILKRIIETTTEVRLLWIYLRRNRWFKTASSLFLRTCLGGWDQSGWKSKCYVLSHSKYTSD